MSYVIYKKISTISPATEFRDQTRLLGFNNDSTTNVFPSYTLTSYMQDKLGINTITTDINKAKEDIVELKPTVNQHTTRIDEISGGIKTLSGNVKTLSTSIQTETESRETKDNEITASINNLKNTLTNQINAIKTTPATIDNFGMIKLGFIADQTAKKYPVELLKGQAFVQVPWVSGEINEDQIGEIVEKYLGDDNIYNALTANNANITNISTEIWKAADPEDPESEDGILARLDSIEDVVDDIAYFDDDNDLISGLIYDTNISVGNLCIEIENLSATVSSDYVKKEGLDKLIEDKINEILSQSSMT